MVREDAQDEDDAAEDAEAELCSSEVNNLDDELTTDDVIFRW